MFPNYIRAPNGAEAKPVSQLYEGKFIGLADRTKQRQTNTNTANDEQKRIGSILFLLDRCFLYIK